MIGSRRVLLSSNNPVATYFNNAQITDTTAQSNIKNWYDLLQSQGLWSNCVTYFLKSTENASQGGSGNTVWSFGGLGSYNGSLSTSAPTWGVNGMTFSGAQSVYNTSLYFCQLGSPFSIMAAVPTYTGFGVLQGTGIIVAATAVSGSGIGSYAFLTRHETVIINQDQLTTGATQQGQYASGINLTNGNSYLFTDVCSTGIVTNGSTPSSQIYLNNVDRGSVTTQVNVTSKAGMSIGANTAGNIDGIKAVIGEVHIFTKALTSNQRNALSLYIQSKYALY